METLYSTPVRTRNNDLISPGDLLLSNFVIVENLGSVRLRLTIESIEIDAEVQVDISWSNGTQELAHMYEAWNQPGFYELAFNRSDIDNSTIVYATINFVNRCRAGFDVLSTTTGEDVLPWPPT